MNNLPRNLLCLVLSAMLCAPCALHAQQPGKPQQFVYVLRLVEKMQDLKSWTEAENQVVARHFTRLEQATESGKVILAGRTTEALDKTFGLVIFEAESPEAAKAFMESDPAVVANIMTATLHPYAVALQRKQ